MRSLRWGVLVLGALALLGTVATDAFAQRRDRDERRPGRGEWVLLGEKSVGFRVDRDVINIGQSEDWYRNRGFSSLHFAAARNDIFMLGLRIVYFNGFAEEFRVDRLIKQGTQLPVDLRGERSYIRQIEMIYRARPDFRGEAVIQVYGEPARRGPPPLPPGRPEWVELGCQDVTVFRKDRDSIEVGRREGRFRAIQLTNRGADVEIRDLTVIYANGEPDRIPVGRVLRNREETGPLDLRGRERAIDRIELTYKARLGGSNLKLKSRVCAEGLAS